MMSDFETMSRPAHVEANVIRVEFGVNCGDHAADKLVHSDLPGVVIDFR